MCKAATCEAKTHTCQPTTYSVALVSDFFEPSVGGVERHMRALADALARLAHRVVVVTHAYPPHHLDGAVVDHKSGVRVYYLPIPAAYARCVAPSAVRLLPRFCGILARERVHVVHTHALCSMSVELSAAAAQLGCSVVHTEHSCYDERGWIARARTQLQRAVLAHTHGRIAVSRAVRASLCSRCGVDERAVAVIGNAVDASRFKPQRSNIRPTSIAGEPTINIVFLARLVPRKGVALLAEVVPAVCARYPRAYFIIGGDGSERRRLEVMIHRHGLEERVELLGYVPSEHAADVLTRGHIFLSTSLTEGFCMVLLEAVSCGLLAVTTRVGGVVELLPHHMLEFSEPEPRALADAVARGVDRLLAGDAPSYHDEVVAMYSWTEVARKTLGVYAVATRAARVPLASRLFGLLRLGPITGPVFVALALAQALALWAIGLGTSWPSIGSGATMERCRTSTCIRACP